jgi:uncharacterized protein YuzE
MVDKMLRKFKFDYDQEHDSLFIYDPHSKSKASIELGDFIIDYNSKGELSGIELLNASAFFIDLGSEDMKVDREMLAEIKDCRIEILPKSNYFVIKFLLIFKSAKQLTTPLIVPTITEPSPALIGA